MDIKDIKMLCEEFRCAMEMLSPDSFSKGLSIGSAKFPAGCCGDTAELLGSYLEDNGLKDCFYVSGEAGGGNSEIKTHAWIEQGDLVIDITADQFQVMGEQFPSVYIGPKTQWYLSFDISKKHPAHISNKKANDPQTFVKLSAAYETILKVILSI
jgi:hypothetical protein